MYHLDALGIASGVLLYGIVIIAVAMDFYRMRISNRLILAGLISSLILRIGQGGWMELFPYLWNITFPVITLYLFYLSGCLGAGDIKLFSVIGGFTSFIFLTQCMLASFLIGAVLSLAKMLYCGSFRSQMYSGGVYLLSLVLGKYEKYDRKREDGGNLIHFALAVFLGLCLVTIYRLR